MKKFFALLLCVALLGGYAGIAEENMPERSVAAYEYALTEEGAYLENLIFNADVIISGEATQMIFSNCEFNGDIILNAGLATRVLLLGCDVNGNCIIRNDVTDADLNYNNPKFLTDTPVTVVCENGVGSVVAIGDFEFRFNGKTYCMAASEFFLDSSHPESEFVAYEGQEADYCIVAQYYENGEKTILVVCEKETAE